MYKELEFKNWNELKQFISNLNSNWIYRGQRDYSWSLDSTIDRVKFNSKNPKIKQQFEQFCIYDLKRNPQLYTNKNIPKSDFQIISLMQHYGSPTRLLDFSLSPFLSIYFAINESNTDSSIFAINYLQLLSSTSHLFRLKYDDESPEVNLFREKENLSDDKVFKKLVLNKNQRKFVQLVQPFILFDRIIQQNGCFLCQGDINIDFETNLKENYEVLQNIKDNEPYYKLKIKREWKKEILRDLFQMNISSSSLFPGIEGKIKSLKDRYEIFNEDSPSTD